MRAIFGTFLSLVLIEMSLPGCSVSRKAMLEESIETYMSALRRGDENIAISYVARPKKAEYYKNFRKLHDLNLSQAEVKTIFPADDLKSAVVTCEIEYYRSSAMSTVQERRQLLWKYDDKLKAWLLDETKPFGN